MIIFFGKPPKIKSKDIDVLFRIMICTLIPALLAWFGVSLLPNKYTIMILPSCFLSSIIGLWVFIIFKDMIKNFDWFIFIYYTLALIGSIVFFVDHLQKIKP